MHEVLLSDSLLKLSIHWKCEVNKCEKYWYLKLLLRKGGEVGKATQLLITLYCSEENVSLVHCSLPKLIFETLDVVFPSRFGSFFFHTLVNISPV